MVSKSDYQKDYKELWDKYQASLYETKNAIATNKRLKRENEMLMSQLDFTRARTHGTCKLAIGLSLIAVLLNLFIIYGG